MQQTKQLTKWRQLQQTVNICFDRINYLMKWTLAIHNEPTFGYLENGESHLRNCGPGHIMHEPRSLPRWLGFWILFLTCLLFIYSCLDDVDMFFNRHIFILTSANRSQEQAGGTTFRKRVLTEFVQSRGGKVVDDLQV